MDKRKLSLNCEKNCWFLPIAHKFCATAMRTFMHIVQNMSNSGLTFSVYLCSPFPLLVCVCETDDNK